MLKKTHYIIYLTIDSAKYSARESKLVCNT